MFNAFKSDALIYDCFRFRIEINGNDSWCNGYPSNLGKVLIDFLQNIILINVDTEIKICEFRI